MAPEDKAALAEAVETLITDADAEQMFKQLSGVYDLARKDVPVKLVGKAAILNPLLKLWVEDETVAENVIELINRKRKDRGLGPIGDADYMRRSYMRELMAQKRERGRRLVDLANRLLSDNDKLRGTARMEFERAHANRWYEVKKQRENAAREQLARRLSATEIADIAQNLWADVDAELDAYEAFVEAEERKPLAARSKGFDFKLQPKKG